MIFDRSTVQRLATNGRLPLTPSSKKDTCASFLVVGEKGSDKKLANQYTTKESAVLLTKSPPSRASTSPTLNETQSITPLSGFSPNVAESVDSTAEQETANSDKESPNKEDVAAGERRDTAQDRIDEVFLKLEENNRVNDIGEGAGSLYRPVNNDVNSDAATQNDEDEATNADAHGNIQKYSSPDDEFAVLKVRYGDHVRLIPINSRTKDTSSATKELALLLSAAFGISLQHKVVGLVASSCAEATEANQPQIVAPLSTVVSERFIREHSAVVHGFDLLVQNASVGGEEGIAEVSSDCKDEHFYSGDIASSPESVSGEETSTGSGSEFGGFVSASLYFRVICQLVENKELDAIHGESLASYIVGTFGREGEVTGPLQIAYFLFAEFTGRIDIFARALRAIAEAIVREQFSDGEYDKEEALLQLSSMAHLLDTAEFLYSSNDLSATAYCTLCHAIIQSDSAVASVYQSYRLCLEQDFDKVATTTLEGTPSTHSLDYLLYAIKTLGESMVPIEVYPDSVDLKEHPTLLTWAFNLGARDLPKQVRDKLLRLFLEEDEFLVSALSLFLIDADVDALVDALLTRFKLSEQGGGEGLLDDDLGSVQEPYDADTVLDSVPDTIVAGVTTLVEHERITLDQASALTAAFALGDRDLEAYHEHFMENGNASEFLDALHSWVDSKEVPIPDTLATNLEEKENIKPRGFDGVVEGDSDDKSPAYDVFLDLFKGFDPCQVAALRLSVARRDPLLRCALETFRQDGDRDTLREALFNRSLEIVTEDAVAADKKVLSERRYGLRLLLAYLVETGKVKNHQGRSLLERFDSGDRAVHDAFHAFELSYDASSFVVRLRSI